MAIILKSMPEFHRNFLRQCVYCWPMQVAQLSKGPMQVAQLSKGPMQAMWIALSLSFSLSLSIYGHSGISRLSRTNAGIGWLSHALKRVRQCLHWLSRKSANACIGPWESQPMQALADCTLVSQCRHWPTSHQSVNAGIGRLHISLSMQALADCAVSQCRHWPTAHQSVNAGIVQLRSQSMQALADCTSVSQCRHWPTP